MTDLARIEELAERYSDSDRQEWTAEQYADDEERQAWRINSKAEAAWAMEKLAKYRLAQIENDKVAADRIAAIQAWQKRENEKLQPSVDYFMEQLRVWHMSLVIADPNDEDAWKKEKFKTISLPDGKVSVRKGSISTTVDEDQFAEWVREWPGEAEGFFAAKIVPIKSAIKTHIEETGELIPGVTVERSEPKFEVKPEVAG